MEEKRFYLTRVKVVSSDDTNYKVGEIYCAIADKEELNVNLDGSQPYGIIHTPVDAAKVAEVIEAANKGGLIPILTDPSFIDWVFRGDYECVEV